MSTEWDEKYRDDLGTEITKLVKELNIVRDTLEKEKKRMTEELAVFAENISKSKESMTGEHISTEDRQKTASKIIGELYDDSRKLLDKGNELIAKSDIESKQAANVMAEAKKISDQAREEMDCAKKLKSENFKRSIDLDRRENSVVDKEMAMNKERTEFDKYLIIESKKIEMSMSEIQMMRESIKAMKNELKRERDEFEKDIQRQKIAIKDERSTLDSAWRELRMVKQK